jgi:hypothetical protein
MRLIRNKKTYNNPKMDSSLCLTENGATALATTQNYCLDLFTILVRNANLQIIIDKFIKAWNESPEMTLKIVFHLRDARNGKGEKKLAIFLMACLYLFQPDIYENNLKNFTNLGYYKDLLRLAELKIRISPFNDTSELSILMTQLLEDENKENPSLAAKWAPTENTYFDKHPLKFVKKLIKFMPKERRTKKEYRLLITKLRAKINILESHLSTNQLNLINFEHIPARAHQNLKNALKRDENYKKIKSPERIQLARRYIEYLTKLNKGEAKIKATSIEPHTIIKKYLSESSPDEVLEAQWKELISKFSGKFKKTQAVCDVSGSMNGFPLEVSIALGLLISELTETPFNNKIITFSDEPTFHNIKGNNLCERVASLKEASWNMNTDLLKVFKLLVDTAKFHNIAKENMVNKIFIFTDMQFDAAINQYLWQNSSSNLSWDTVYSYIEKLYQEADYNIPQIVFWNLRQSVDAFPVTFNKKGVAVVSGFSPTLLKLFLDEEEFTPMKILENAVKNYKVNVSSCVPINDSSIFAKLIEISKCLDVKNKKK